MTWENQLHLIITDPWLARQRPIHLDGWQLVGIVCMVMSSLILMMLLIYHSLFVYGARQGWPIITPIVEMIASKERANQERYLKENLEALARKLGELQARLVQLESLGERVSSLAGLPEGQSKLRNGAGGMLVLPQDHSIVSLQTGMDAVGISALSQFDRLTEIESRLFSEKIRKSMLPTAEPVQGVSTASGFGWRTDPLTGQKALHTGLDFPADVGTPILAAAGGMVVAREFHPAYGNMIEIDHGNALITRYAHASRLLVNVGNIVKRGQLVAEVGSTGRSTGPHLHFEVWLAGVAQNPQVFLEAGERPSVRSNVAGSRWRKLPDNGQN